ncbi:unnamed protein product [Meganyctiphanes norvegica]|uniref:Methyltransferase FkbM domain-containing protein n=1 Tax=Meganyctiphanes norvegica TaxID=48144 RepID=A0AAV2RKS2_MEGNR
MSSIRLICAMPGRLPRALPMTVLLVTVATIITLLFMINVPAHRAWVFHESLNLSSHTEFEGAPQHHPELVSYIRQLHILPPSDGNYNLHAPETSDFSQNGQSRMVEKILNGKKRGFFVEAGAYNGEDLSNTLYLERQFDWGGLLVEPDPWNFWALRTRHRKAFHTQACLSPAPYPREVTFRQSDTMGHIAGAGEEEKGRGIFTRVKCFPIFSLLLACNRTNIDLLSLDIEGAELQVLKTIPWDKVHISVIIVEYVHLTEGGTVLKNYLESIGYNFYDKLGDDFIFVSSNIEQEKQNKGL